MKNVLILFLPLVVFLLFSCEEPGLDDKVSITVENASDEAVFILLDWSKRPYSTKDFNENEISGDLIKIESGGSGEYGTTKGNFLQHPFATIIIFRESTLKRFTAHDAIENDIYDDRYNLTYSDLELYGFRIVYHGYSNWQEQTQKSDI